MKNILAGIGLLALGFAAAHADVIMINPVTPVPYPYNPSGAMQSQLSITTGAVVTLTIPSGTLYARVCIRSGAGAINFTDDGLTTPVTGVTGAGTQLSGGQCLPEMGIVILKNFQAIAETATTAIDVSYWK